MSPVSGAMVYIMFIFFCFEFATSSSNYAIGWRSEGKAIKNYILEADFDNMTVTPLFPLDIAYNNGLSSAYDEVHQVVFLMAEPSYNSNKFAFYSIDLNTNTTKTYDVPAAILPFESDLRWISTTPDVVYIFSWKAAYTFKYSDSTFQEFLNFSKTFNNIIPENAASPSPFYFDTNANVLFCYFVYYGPNNKVEMMRIGVSMSGEIVEKEAISCIPAHDPFFDPTNNNTYSVSQITQPNELYDYVQTTTQKATCTDSKTIFASPLSLECYMWDSANKRMLMANWQFNQGPSICKYTDGEWDLTCQIVDFQLEDIYPRA